MRRSSSQLAHQLTDALAEINDRYDCSRSKQDTWLPFAVLKDLFALSSLPLTDFASKHLIDYRSQHLLCGRPDIHP